MASFILGNNRLQKEIDDFFVTIDIYLIQCLDINKVVLKTRTNVFLTINLSDMHCATAQQCFYYAES